jgi:hypothetical protein
MIKVFSKDLMQLIKLIYNSNNIIKLDIAVVKKDSFLQVKINKFQLSMAI